MHSGRGPVHREYWPASRPRRGLGFSNIATRMQYQMTPAFPAQSEPQESADRASPDEIIELRRLGFKVEDLGAEYGPAHQGAFRWVNIVAGEFEQDAESHSETEAWAAAKEAAAANEKRQPSVVCPDR
jgi:hypothetical protein